MSIYFSVYFTAYSNISALTLSYLITFIVLIFSINPHKFIIFCYTFIFNIAVKFSPHSNTNFCIFYTILNGQLSNFIII